MQLTRLTMVTVASLAAGVMLIQFNLQSGSAQEKIQDSLQQTVTEDMQLVLQKLKDLGAKPLGTQSVEETRKGPTPADAANAVLQEQGKDPNTLLAQLKITKRDLAYPAGNGDQSVRIYTPQGEAPQGGWPVIVYYHGGGWVIATIDTYEASAMALANKVQAIVVSVEYRHAPENKFPAAHEDAFLAYQWVLNNAQQWNGNLERVAVSGESAGGNLAINTAILARDRGVAAPRHMLLVYPVAGVNFDTPSYREHANAIPLNKTAMQWFFNHATNSQQDLQDSRLDLVGHATLDRLPSATIITAQIDPLRSEGKDLSDKLKAAGSAVTYHNFDGVTHEFFGLAAVLGEARQAQELAARDLRKALEPLSTSSTSGSGGESNQ